MSKHRLLIIEDNEDIAELIGLTAAAVGFEVRAMRRASEIPALYKEFSPHVIVLDVVMPDMDGFEVLNFLHQQNSPSRIIILSGQEDFRPMAGRMAEGLKIHLAAIIAKPFRPGALRQILEGIKSSLPESNGNSPSESAA